MKRLTNNDIYQNRVDTINQFKVLSYLKDNLNVFEFDLFLYDKDTIKVIDKENKVAYFKYDASINDVLFIDETYEIEL